MTFREEWGRLVASLVGSLRDVDLAEDAAQEAFAIAAEAWARQGPPPNPGAWLLTTARNRAIDRLRRDRTLAAKTRLLELERPKDLPVDHQTIPDERLELIFMCCHPGLGTDAQVALTLRAVGGLRTEEIARAFLVPTETMKRRLTRAKAKIKAAGIPFGIPADHVLPDRLAGVLGVVYLIFNEGYAGREELAAEAIRLGRVLTALMPDEAEVHGLLALMLLHHSRRRARAVDGELVLLPDQDRTSWDRGDIEAGEASLRRALAFGGRGPYVLQAAVASLHMEPRPDWREIAALYGELEAATRSPVVTVNRSVAIAEIHGPEAGLELLETVDLAGYQYFHSTRADLLRRAGRLGEARAAYQRALELARGTAEQAFLRARIQECAQPPEPRPVDVETGDPVLEPEQP